MSTTVTWNSTSRSIPAAGELNWSSLSNFLIDLAQNAQTTNFQKIGLRVATTSPVTVSASTDCVIVCKLSSAGAVAVNLPAGVSGQVFCIVDGTGDAATNNITITPASGNINGAATYVIDGNRHGIIITYSGTEWIVLAEFISSSSGDIPRAQIAAGTASYVLINDGSGNMSEEAQLAASRGGLGTNASAFTGVVKASAGSFSAATVVNADVSASAAIDHSKLANITAGQVLMGNGSNVPTATALSGDVTVNSSGVTSIGSGVIVNDDINASAAIVDTKLATISTAGKVSNSATTATSSNTASAIVARDASGNFTAGTITATLSGTATNVSGTVAIANGGTGQTTATAAFDALAPTTTQGDTIYHNGTDNVRLAKGSAGQVLTMNSGATAPEWADAGGGAGEKNYIENPSAASAITGWTNVGDLDVARTTTAGDLPREYTTGSGIKITADANTQSTADYVYYDFTLDDVDLNKKLKIQWAQKTTGTYNAGDLAVVITTQADRTTALHTPITTAIPAADGVFTTYFDSTSTATLSLVIRATTDMTTDGGIVISDVIVGPGIQPQGAVVGEWQAAGTTPTIEGMTVAGSVTYSTQKARYKRVGSSIEIAGQVALSTVTTAPTGFIKLLTFLPSGLTVDASSALEASGSTTIFGHGMMRDATAGKAYKFSILWDETNGTYFYFNEATDGKNPITLAASDSFRFYATIPISEWAGSGTVNLAQNDVEYAATSGTWDANDTTTVYGPSGGSITGALTNARTKTVTFKTPIQPTDEITVELSEDGQIWLPANGFRLYAGTNFVGTSFNTGGSLNLSSGVFAAKVTGSTTQINVTFARYTYLANDDLPVGDWENGWKWRVKKCSAGQAVGFGAATTTSSGLVSTGTQSFAGAKGFTGRWIRVGTVDSDTAETNIYIGRPGTSYGSITNAMPTSTSNTFQRTSSVAQAITSVSYDYRGSNAGGMSFGSIAAGTIGTTDTPTWHTGFDSSGVWTFNSGIVLDDAAGQSTLNYYRTETWATTWTTNGSGPGTSASVNIILSRIGNFVTAYIPAFNATTGSGSPDRITADTAMPSWARPSTQHNVNGGATRNNGASSGDVAQWVIQTSGSMVMFRNNSSSTFTASTSCGLQAPTVITWYAG